MVKENEDLKMERELMKQTPSIDAAAEGKQEVPLSVVCKFTNESTQNSQLLQLYPKS